MIPRAQPDRFNASGGEASTDWSKRLHYTHTVGTAMPAAFFLLVTLYLNAMACYRSRHFRQYDALCEEVGGGAARPTARKRRQKPRPCDLFPQKHKRGQGLAPGMRDLYRVARRTIFCGGGGLSSREAQSCTESSLTSASPVDANRDRSFLLVLFFLPVHACFLYLAQRAPAHYADSAAGASMRSWLLVLALFFGLPAVYGIIWHVGALRLAHAYDARPDARSDPTDNRRRSFARAVVRYPPFGAWQSGQEEAAFELEEQTISALNGHKLFMQMLGGICAVVSLVLVLLTARCGWVHWALAWGE